MPPAKKDGPLKPVKLLPNTQQLCSVRFSPCGKLLAAGSFEGSVRRWDSASDAYPELPPLGGHNGWVQTIGFHPDQKRLFSADSWGEVRCWPHAEKDAKPLWAVKNAHDGWVYQLAVSPDGKLVATGGRDGTVRLADPANGKELGRFRDDGEHVLAVAFHPDGKHLLSGDLKGVVKQRELPSGKVVRTFDARVMFLRDRIQDVGGVRCFAFDRTGSVMLVGGGQPKSGGFVQGNWLILSFDWKSGQLKQTLKGATENDGYVYDMHLHPDGRLLAATSGQPGNGRLLMHRLGDAQPYLAHALPNCHSLALHPNGTRLVVSATNANSAGNGRQIGKGQEYPGNFSPLHLFDLAKPA